MDKDKKRWLPLALMVLILIAILGCILWGIFIRGRGAEAAGYVRLKQHDIAIDVGETAELEIAEVKANFDIADAELKWISNNSSVVSVDESGIITGKAGGEAKITVVAKNGKKEYTSSCIVTVKAEGFEYSSYQIQWYAQRKDRNGYDVSVETYERLVGSEVNLTRQDAKAKLPAYYVLNEDKCVLSGTVKESKAGCVLKVYYDVAKISYSIDYYYESDSALGTYELKESKKCKEYAFSEVSAPLEVAEGFVVNEKAKGTVLTVDSVVSNSRLKVYCERIRSKVTIKYANASRKARKVTYDNVYGVGLVGAPADALEENLAPYETAVYLAGKQVKDIESAVKKLTEDARVEFRVAGRGFTYQKDGALLEEYYDIAQSAYTYLPGSGKTIYLSANYNLTGSTTNMSGITLRSGDENRQILFNHQGVVVLKNYAWQPGTVTKKAFEFNHPEETGYILMQNQTALEQTKPKSAISKMLTNTEASSHEVIWAVWEGTLYCSVDGDVVVRLPLNQLVTSWTADTKFEIGFAAYDGVKVADKFTVRDVEVQYDSDAKNVLHTNGKAAKMVEIRNQAYDPISGAYVPACADASWIYGPETAKNSGLTADVTWMDKDNTGSLVGATVRMGDQSVQYYVQGQNRLYRTQRNHGWTGTLQLDMQRINGGVLFDKNGTSKIGAYVKDGYFYVTFNGVQAQCVNMLSLFPDYTRDSQVSVGVCTKMTTSGLAYFKNIDVLDENAVAEQQELVEWRFYSEILYGNPEYDFAEGTIVKDKAGYHEAVLLGSSQAWHVKGVMKRTDAQNAGDLLMGWKITVGDKTMILYGHNKGFIYKWNNYDYNGGNNRYSFGDSHGQFFSDVRNKDELPFELVIYDDILYVYLDGELSWRIPLTEEQFGFEPDSRYKVTLSMVDTDRKGAFEDIEVSMGYQVADESEFMTYQGKTYSFEDAMSITEANASKYQNVNNIFQRGNLLEESVFTTKKGQAYLTTESDAYQGFKTTIVHKVGASDSLFNGIILKSGEDTARIMVDSAANMIILQQEEKLSTAKYVSGITDAYENNKCELTVAVKDGKLFLTANGTALGAIDLVKLLENYQQGDKIIFGICSENSTPGVVGFTDITTLTGKEEDIEYHDSEMQLSDVRFRVEAMTPGAMTVDTVNGNIKVDLTSGGVKTLWFATDDATYSSKAWEITGTFKQLASLMKGFTIQSADASKIGYYTMWSNGVSLNKSWGDPVAGGWNVYASDNQYVFANADYNALGTNDVEKRFKLVLQNDILSFLVENKPVWQLPLTDEKFGGFEKGTSYRVALRCLDNGGKAEWSDLTVKYGENVGAYRFLVHAMTPGAMAYDIVNGNIKVNLTDGGVKTLWFATDNTTHSSKAWEITGTFKELKTLTKGFIIRQADYPDRWRYFRMSETGVTVIASWGETGSYSVDKTSIFTNADYNAIGNGTTKKFKAVIQNDIFSFWVEDKLVWQLPLTDSKFGTFTKGSEYEFGLRCQGNGGQAEWSDLAVKYGEKVGPYKFLVSAMSNDMTADTMTGKVTANLTNGDANTYWFATDYKANSSKVWEITGTFKELKTLTKGFIIRQADYPDRWRYFRISATGVTVVASWGDVASYTADGKLVFTNADYNVIGDGTSKKFKAVIQDDIFSFWVEDKLVWQLPLTDTKFGTFTKGSAYEFGLRCQGNGGKAEWSDLTVKYGE